MSFEIEIDASSLEAGLRDLDRELDREMAHAIALSTDIVEREAKQLAPKVSGALADSIQALPPSGTWQSGTLEGRVIADTEYALPVHDGSRAHTIRPLNAHALRFVIGGRTVFARRVQHPGTHGYPFLELALEIRAPEVEAQFANAHAAAIDRAGFGR